MLNRILIALICWVGIALAMLWEGPMKIAVGRTDGEVLLRIDGDIGEKGLNLKGRHGGRVVIHLRVDPDEAKRVGITMLDEANYCDEEKVS